MSWRFHTVWARGGRRMPISGQANLVDVAAAAGAAWVATADEVVRVDPALVG
jgi:hypothetical protein